MSQSPCQGTTSGQHPNNNQYSMIKHQQTKIKHPTLVTPTCCIPKPSHWRSPCIIIILFFIQNSPMRLQEVWGWHARWGWVEVRSWFTMWFVDGTRGRKWIWVINIDTESYFHLMSESPRVMHSKHIWSILILRILRYIQGLFYSHMANDSDNSSSQGSIRSRNYSLRSNECPRCSLESSSLYACLPWSSSHLSSSSLCSSNSVKIHHHQQHQSVLLCLYLPFATSLQYPTKPPKKQRTSQLCTVTITNLTYQTLQRPCPRWIAKSWRWH